MMNIRRLATVVMLAFAVGVAVGEDVIEWNYYYLQEVSDYLVSECRNSRRITDFTSENGRAPRVILGEIKNRTDVVINTSVLARQFQNALINSGVVDFVADSSERWALRDEKSDQDYHASIDSAKAIDNESAADFMLQGEIYFLQTRQEKRNLIHKYSLIVQFHDIEKNTIVFSKEFPFDAIESIPRGDTGRNQETGSTQPYSLSSLSFAIPIINRSFDADETDSGGSAECEFNVVTFGVDYSIFAVNTNKLATLIKIGAAAGNGEISAKYKGNSEITLDEITTYALYGRLGFGRAFSSYYGTVVFVPTVGAGVFYEYLSAEYESDAYSSSKDFTGYDLTIDIFINTFLAIMLSDRWGISFSFELSMNVWGMGSFTELGEYNTDFGSLSFIPTIGICRRF